MAQINNTLNLTDRMSPVLKTVLKAIDSTMRAMDQLDRATNKGMNTAAFKQARRDIDAATAAVNSLNGNLEKTGGILSKISNLASTSMAKIQNFGTSIMNRGYTNQNRGQRLNSNKLYGLGSLQVGTGALINALGSAPGKIAAFGNSLSSAFTAGAEKAKLAYTEALSFIGLVEKGIGAINSLMSANDQVTSDVAKIGLFNYDENMSNVQAYGMAYQAAEASRSDLSDTTTLINRIMMSGVYGQEAGSLSSATRMAETLNKALVVGGGTSEENQRALVQLSQGLSSGVLQGDELRSIREQSPYLAQVLAEGLAQVDDKFIGTTVGDLKELGAQGELTSDVVIKAFEAMQDQVDATFEDKAPRTWAQGITSISNTIKVVTAYLQSMEGGPLSKISELVWIIADYLKSEDGLRLMAGMASALTVIGTVLNWVVTAALNGITWLMDNSWVLYTILLAIAIVVGYQLLAAFFSLLGAALPFLVIAALIVLIIMLFEELCGVVLAIGAFIVNFIIGCINAIISFIYAKFVTPFLYIIEWVLNAVTGGFDSLGDAAKNLIGNLISWFLDFGKVATTIIDAIFGSDWTGRLSELQDKVSAWGKNDNAITIDKSAPIIDYRIGYGDAYNAGYEWGSGIKDKIGEAFGLSSGEGLTDKLAKFMEGNASLYEDATGGGVNVAGGNLDSVGSIKNDVNLNDEDIQLLRDMAARDYLLNLQQVTPVAHISFGDVRETADVNKIMDVIEDMVEEQMATALVAN